MNIVKLNDIIEDNNESKKEELIRNISEMLEALPFPEIIRTYSYLSTLYFH